MRVFFVFCAIWVMMVGCHDDTSIGTYASLHHEEWDKGDSIVFKLNIPQSGLFRPMIAVRHTVGYNMSNLWCIVSLRNNRGLHQSDTVNVNIAQYNGRWVGYGSSLKTILQPISEPIRIPDDTLTVSIRPYMRNEHLNGIANIGIDLIKL